LVRKPISEKTVAQNVLKWGTGGINIDGCRIETNERIEKGRNGRNVLSWKQTSELNDNPIELNTQGRFPANLILDGSEEVIKLFPNTKSGLMKKGQARQNNELTKNTYGKWNPDQVENDTYGDSGSASRFFYCAKPSKSERNFGCENLEEKEVGHNRFDTCKTCGGIIFQNPDRPSACKCKIPIREHNKVKGNNHPTIKSIKLMKYLCKLITPKNGTILDPFMGSGSTGIAAKLERYNFIGIEKEEDYCNIAEHRIKAWRTHTTNNTTTKQPTPTDNTQKPLFII